MRRRVRSPPPRPCGRDGPNTPSTRRAASTTRCRHERAASACTTTRRSRSRGCSRTAPSGSRTSTSTSTTATGSRRSSGTSPGSCTISLHEYGTPFFPGTGASSRTRRPARPRGRDQRAACRRHRRRRRGSRRSTIVPPRGRRLRARRARDPARVRHPRVGPARAARAHDALPTGKRRARCTGSRTTPPAAAGSRPAAGGYQWARVVPRAWTMYFAEMADAADDLPDALPESWIERRDGSRRRAGADDVLGAAARRPSCRRGRARRGRAARRHTVGLMARTKLVCTLGPASASPSLVQGSGPGRDIGVPAELLARYVPRSTRGWCGSCARPRTRRASRSPCSSICPARRCGCRRWVRIRSRSGRGSGSSSDPRARRTSGGASTTYPGLSADLQEGDRVLLADGAVELTVSAIAGDVVQTECVAGGNRSERPRRERARPSAWACRR